RGFLKTDRLAPRAMEEPCSLLCDVGKTDAPHPCGFCAAETVPETGRRPSSNVGRQRQSIDRTDPRPHRTRRRAHRVGGAESKSQPGCRTTLFWRAHRNRNSRGAARLAGHDIPGLEVCEGLAASGTDEYGREKPLQ